MKEHPPYLSEEERKALLGAARRALETCLRGGDVPAEKGLPGKLAEPGAAFVTLTRKGRLRGCIGYVEAQAPLFRTVQECAVAAGTQDTRFPPVTAAEAPGLRIEISVLTPMRSIRTGEVEVGKHGLMIVQGPRRGLLLPQVATEYGWDRETFLSHLCIKAGLPPDAWKKERAELYCFTAEVFGE